jgi:hypothetical protein
MLESLIFRYLCPSYYQDYYALQEELYKIKEAEDYWYYKYLESSRKGESL